MQNSTVKMIYINENAPSIIASAGRMSTTKGNAIEIYDKACEKDRADNISLIRKIISSGHTSVLEHAFINLAFNNVSVFVEQFMIEFRLASFTVKSRRYVDFGEMGFIMPDFSDDAVKEKYTAHMEYLFAEYNYLLEQGIPKEDARFVLPYSFRSNFYCTVNARELVKIVNEMVWGRGKEYPEIVSLGKSLLEQCEKELPFLHFGEGSTMEDVPELHGVMKKDRTEEQKDLVTVLSIPDHPEETICKAAMLSRGALDWMDCRFDEAQQKQIIQQILSSGRRRELEQINFTILFHGVSLAGVTHLVRHRMQSIIVPRYLNSCKFENHIMPESIVAAGLQKRYEGVFAKSKEVFDSLNQMGFKPCDRVYLFLSGMTVPILTTMNANELFTFIRLRSCTRAQWEIRNHAIALLDALRKEFPVLFSLYGPSCYVTGKCPEGKMTCGQIERIKAAFTFSDK